MRIVRDLGTSREERGAALTEYALLVALFALVLVLAVDRITDRGTDKLDSEDERVGMIEDNAAYQPPSGPGGPPPPPDPDPGGGTLGMPSVTSRPATDSSNKWVAQATITVVDSGGGPVSGVSVEFRWSSGSSPNDNCVTNDSGQCQVSQTVNDGTASVTIQITDLSKSGWTEPALPFTSGGVPCSPPLVGDCDAP